MKPRAIETTSAAVGRMDVASEVALWVVVVIWASTWIAIKDAFDYIEPLAFLLVRFVLINMLAFSVLLVQHRRDSKVSVTISRKDLPRFIASGVTGFTLYQLCAVLGLERSSVFTLSLLVAMTPLFTMVILAIRREPVPPYGWLGVATAILGVVVFLLNKREGGDTILGAALSLGAAISFACYGIVSRPLARGYAPATYSAYTLLIGTLPLVVIGAPATLRQDWSAIPAHVWLGLVYLVIFPVYLAYQLWNYAISRRGVAGATSYSLLIPILSGIMSGIILGEHFGVLKIVGAALVIVGLLVLRIERSKSAETRQSQQLKQGEVG